MLPQSEVIRAILLEYSPCCWVPHRLVHPKGIDQVAVMGVLLGLAVLLGTPPRVFVRGGGVALVPGEGVPRSQVDEEAAELPEGDFVIVGFVVLDEEVGLAACFELFGEGRVLLHVDLQAQRDDMQADSTG